MDVSTAAAAAAATCAGCDSSKPGYESCCRSQLTCTVSFVSPVMRLRLVGRCATALMEVSALSVIFTSGICCSGVKSSPLSDATVAESAMQMSICCRRPREARKEGSRGKPSGELWGKMSSGFGPIRREVRAASFDRDSIDSVAAYTVAWLHRRTSDCSWEACAGGRGGGGRGQVGRCRQAVQGGQQWWQQAGLSLLVVICECPDSSPEAGWTVSPLRNVGCIVGCAGSQGELSPGRHAAMSCCLCAAAIAQMLGSPASPAVSQSCPARCSASCPLSGAAPET